MADKLAVITLTRTPHLFDNVADCLKPQLPKGTLGIVVNNGQDFDVTKLAVKYGWACIETPTNLPFAEGNNLAAKVATAEGCTHLLLMNDDLIPDADYVANLWENRRYAERGVLGGVFVHSDNGGSVNHAGTLVYPDGVTDHMGRYDDVRKWEQDRVVPVVAVTFASCLISTAYWNELKGLDARYFWGWEDTDFCLRVIDAGGINFVHRGAGAVHDECGTRPRGSRSDSMNRDLFIQTWQYRLPDLLRAYFNRVPNAEGIRP
ncbi:hypothetical protein LCGC14_1723410 [marine sediment metagenome]|uniref:Glycosyltransferase 2-like domain-containing protein n=1 Tax=marine sediment metagenome TaxID=412755 RepID=A0A0F9HBG8_9ZZZZ